MSDLSDESTTSSRGSYLLIGAIALGGIVIAVGAAIILLFGGDDEAETKGACQGSSYELGAEREDDNRMTASLEVKADAVGEEWRVRITADGTEVVEETRTTDSEAELDVDAFLGTGEKATDVVATFGRSGAESCTARVTLG